MKHTAPKFNKLQIKYFGKALCRKFRDYEAGWNIDFVNAIDAIHGDEGDKLIQFLYDSIGVIAGSEDMYNEIQSVTDENKKKKIIGFIFRRAIIWTIKEGGDGNEEGSDEDDDE